MERRMKAETHRSDRAPPDRTAPYRSPGWNADNLGRSAGQLRVFLPGRRSACTDHRLRPPRRSPQPTPWRWCSTGWRLGSTRSASTLVLQSPSRPTPSWRCCLSMLVTVCRLRARADLQRADPGAQPAALPGPADLPGAAGRGYPALQSRYRAGRRRSAAALELAREIARRFNQLYGATFPEPQALLSAMPRLPGIDNRTMHTSYGNAIYLRDTPEETTRKVMSMYTDPTRIHATDPGHVEGNPVFTYLDVLRSEPGGGGRVERTLPGRASRRCGGQTPPGRGAERVSGPAARAPGRDAPPTRTSCSRSCARARRSAGPSPGGLC